MLVTTHVRKKPGVCRISVNNLTISYETRMVFVNTRHHTHTHTQKLLNLYFHILFSVQYSVLFLQGHTR